MAPSNFEMPYVTNSIIEHTHTIIALHGRGSQGEEFANELFEGITSEGHSLRQAFPSARWVFPSSQERYSTVFQEELDEWFDIYSLTDPAAREELQVEGLHDSVEFLLGVVRDEVKELGGQNERVFLMGLSQGCATALMVLLATELKLGGFLGLNGWLPFGKQIGKSEGNLVRFFQSQLHLERCGAKFTASVRYTPVLLGHTADDEVIDIELGRQARDTLRRLGMNITWQEQQRGGHLGMLNTPGLDAIALFLKTQW